MSSADIPIDQALLAQARRVLGTSSTRDTLERALSLAIQHENHQQAVEAEVTRFASGHYSALRSQRAASRIVPQDQP